MTGQHLSLYKDPIVYCSLESVRELHILCPLAILDKDSFVAAAVYVPGSIAFRLQVGSFEFVSLSRRRGQSTDTIFESVRIFQGMSLSFIFTLIFKLDQRRNSSFLLDKP